ncbi:ATP-binding protein [Leptolyngbya sp. AN10]|uniref:ATP-binding protein n=1 Tax=Leptolyngbya sp. AN10 TaxID=3423365 RepID=UPI003D3164BC
MKRFTEIWIISGFSLAFFFLLGASIASYSSVVRLNESQKRVAHTDDVLETLNEFTEQLQTADREQKAFLLTKNKIHRDRYQIAIQSVSETFSETVQLTQDNASQQKRLSELKPLISAQTASLQRAIEQKQKTNAIEDSLENLDRYAAIQAQLSQIMAEEKNLMRQRLDTSDREIRAIASLAGIGYCLSFVLIIVTSHLLRRQMYLDQKLSEETLSLQQQQHQTKLSNILESITDAFVTLDRDWRYVYVNQRAAQMFNCQSEDLLGKQIWAEFPEGIRQPFYHAYHQALAQQKMVQLEEYYSPWDRWFENRIYPSEDGLSIFFQDITPRKQAEIKLKRSEERYRALVDATAQFVWTATEEGLTSESYLGWQALTGQTPEEMANHGWVNALHPDDRAKALEAWTTAVQTQGIYEGRYRILTKEGIYRHSMARGVPVLEPDGSVREWVGTCIDMTQAEQLEAQRRQAEIELRRAKENLEIKVKERTTELQLLNIELERSNQELEQFAYIASHDLQEPLRAITSYSQLLEDEYREHLNDEAQTYLSFVLDGSRQMQQLIKDLLVYSRVTTQSRKFQAVDCEAVLQQVLYNLKIAIDQSNAQITHDPLPSLIADRTQLIQLFQNLISNALKFQEQRPKIHISVQQKHDSLYLFSVSDHGIGIKAQYLDRIFEVFRRLHTRRDFPGTGIGLAICKKIVECHGGEIWAESEFGSGTTFYFTIASAKVEKNDFAIARHVHLDDSSNAPSDHYFVS